ncbi:MAG: EutN/CcmL family microcompartment protein [Acidobacteria bacterium]|nr:EutN/CcmL family microcompartment protein [Acidobacteriota bacterium]
MLIGRVIGEVVASAKHPSHEQLKLLAVARLELDGSQKESAPLIAIDSVGAGKGDRVLVTLDGWGAMTAVDRFPAPIDCAVLGIIDDVEIVED